MRTRTALAFLFLLVVSSLVAEASISTKAAYRGGQHPCDMSQYDRCNSSCDFFDAQCWYGCMWGLGYGDGISSYANNSGGFSGCTGTCSNPCQKTLCDSECGNQSSCANCCYTFYNRAVKGCQGQACRDTQISERNACLTNCELK